MFLIGPFTAELDRFRVTSVTEEAASQLTIKLCEDDRLKLVEPQILEKRLKAGCTQADANIPFLELLLASLRS